MEDKKLIILYGEIGTTSWKKADNLIRGVFTCGYRSYAEKFGSIIYMTAQETFKSWEHSMTSPQEVIDFINKYPNAIVWAVKHAPDRDQRILSKITNKKMYYSCCNKKMYNSYCDISLVDTDERLKNNAKVFVKGKDENFWKPIKQKKRYDYLFVGQRGDKNEIFFLNHLNKIKKKRRILWVGGKKHRKKVRTIHDVTYTSSLNSEGVRDNISKAKVGILFTELGEGFPQSFLEMTMCGVPVVYNKKAPFNKNYFFKQNSLRVTKKNLIIGAESLLKTFNSEKCREVAINNYSLEKSFERLRNL